MCGHFALYSTYPRLSESLRLPLETRGAELAPRYNVPPGTFISAVRGADDEARLAVISGDDVRNRLVDLDGLGGRAT